MAARPGAGVSGRCARFHVTTPLRRLGSLPPADVDTGVVLSPLCGCRGRSHGAAPSRSDGLGDDVGAGLGVQVGRPSARKTLVLFFVFLYLKTTGKLESLRLGYLADDFPQENQVSLSLQGKHTTVLGANDPCSFCVKTRILGTRSSQQAPDPLGSESWR